MKRASDIFPFPLFPLMFPSCLLVEQEQRPSGNGDREAIVVERTEVEPFDRITGIERNAVEFYRICCMAWSLRSLRQVATLRHGQMARRFAPAFRALGVCEHI